MDTSCRFFLVTRLSRRNWHACFSTRKTGRVDAPAMKPWCAFTRLRKNRTAIRWCRTIPFLFSFSFQLFIHQLVPLSIIEISSVLNLFQLPSSSPTLSATINKSSFPGRFYQQLTRNLPRRARILILVIPRHVPPQLT